MGNVGKLSLALGIVFLFGLGACKKNNDRPIDGRLVKAFDYKVGTYWIMRDSISGRVDSFFVTNNQFYNMYNYDREDDIGIQISEYTGGNVNVDKILWEINLVGDGFYFDISGAKGLYYLDNGALFTYPFIANPYENILSNYILNGSSYSNVAQLIQNPGDYDDWFYINATDGFIKIRLYHPAANVNYVWELQHANLIR